ncbi:MAG: hypothetical protein JOZ75_07670 [Candidatus Dormibacteraeota bacterium]|nr:hypothetical protein [Candidatus Dormibacteraeota bacterium]
MPETPRHAQAEASYGLPQIFSALRADLIASQDVLLGADRKPMLQVTEAQIELAFTLEHSLTGGGGINLKFFGVGFEGKGEKGRTEGTTHRLTLSLGPVEGAETGVVGPLPPAE